MKLMTALMLVLIVDSVAAVQLGGTSSLALLEGLQNNSSDLWTWGSAPVGYIVLNDSSVAGAVIPEADKIGDGDAQPGCAAGQNDEQARSTIEFRAYGGLWQKY